MKKLILAATSATALLALSACGDAAEEPVDETTVLETDVIEPLPADPALDAEVDPALDPALDPATDPLATDPALDPAAEPTADEEAPAM